MSDENPSPDSMYQTLLEVLRDKRQDYILLKLRTGEKLEFTLKQNYYSLTKKMLHIGGREIGSFDFSIRIDDIVYIKYYERVM